MKLYIILIIACALHRAASDAASLRSSLGLVEGKDKEEASVSEPPQKAINETEWANDEQFHRHLQYLAGYPGATPSSGAAAAAAAAAGKSSKFDSHFYSLNLH